MNLSTQHVAFCFQLSDVMVDYYEFYDMTQYKSVQTTVGVIYSTIFLLGMLGNLSIIASIARRKRIRLVANMFLVNLSATQIVLCLTSLPLTPTTLIQKEWKLGQILCKIFPMLNTVTVLVISLSLCCIAIDRYRNIVYPTRSHWTEKNALLMILLCLLLAVIMTVPYVVSQELKPMGDPLLNITFCGEFCGEFGWLARNPELKKIYGAALLFVQYGLPVILMSFCYWKILWKVKADLIIGGHACRPVQAQAAARKRSVMRVLVLMVFAFVSSWLPLALLNILRDFEVSIDEIIDNQFYLVQLISHAIAMTGVIWNPLLYFWMSKTHRTALKRTFTQVGERTMGSVGSAFFHRRFSQTPLDVTETLPLNSHRPARHNSFSPNCSYRPQRPQISSPKSSNNNNSLGVDPAGVVRRCSLDPFVDFNFVHGRIQEYPVKENRVTKSKNKYPTSVHRIKGRGKLSKKLPDIVTCAEEETEI